MSIIKNVQKVLLFAVVMLAGLIAYNTTNAANELQFSGYFEKISPNTEPASTGILNAYCWYPVDIWAHSSGYSVMSVDAKFFASGMGLTGFQTGNAFPNYYSFLSGSYWWPGTGVSQFADGSYPSNTPYTYINAYVDLTNQTGDVVVGNRLARVFFRNVADIINGELSFYYITGAAEDSQMQSGVSNLYQNVVTSVTDFGGLTFVKRPCILDQQAPLFTGQSGSELVFFTDNFLFTIYDWTGDFNISQLYNPAVTNPTYHYYWTGGSYVPVTGSNLDIDNQMGVNSGCSIATIVGTTNNGFTGEGVFPSTNLMPSLVYTSFVLNNWITTYTGEGEERTWTGYKRGYSYQTGLYYGLSGVEDNQTITVTLSGCDYPNQSGDNHTGTYSYTINLTGFDKYPPYITTGPIYTFVTYSGGVDQGIEIDAGYVRSSDAALVSGWLLWTSGNVDLLTTGNESNIIITGTIAGTLPGYFDQILPLLSSDVYSIYKTITFNGNYLNGTYSFLDNPPYAPQQPYNTGYTWQTGGNKYVDTFYFDVFWIDRAAPYIVTGTLQDNPAPGETRLLLTGSDTGNSNSINDDTFIVLGFSGVVPAPVRYDTGYATGVFSLSHTGIIFTGFWEGCVKVRDRAGNEICVYVNISITTRNMLIKALPEQRVNLFGFDADMNFWSGDLASATGDNYTDSGIVNFTNNGTGIFRITLPSSGGDYLVLLKGHGYLSHGLTGLFVQDMTGFDFTTGASPFDWIKVFGVPNISSLYPGDRTLIVWGDVASGTNDIVNSLDLATVNANLTVDFTLEPQPLRVGGPEDDYVTAEEQAVIINNNLRQGFWKTNKPTATNPWVFTGY